MKRNVVVLWLMLTLLMPGFGWCAGNEIPAPPDLNAIKVLDLPTAQRLALVANPSMDVALARVEQARARVRQASAAWWPTLDMTGAGGRSRRSDSSLEPSQALANLYGQNIDRTTEEYAAGLQATWLLFDGFYRSFNEEQAGYGEKSAVAAREDAQRLLVAAVAEAFLNAQLAQTNVMIAGSDRDFYSLQLRDVQNRYDAGAGPWGDVLNIKVQLNSAKTNFLLASREFEAAGYGLAALLGVAEARFPEHLSLKPLAQEDVTSTAVTPEQLIKEALARRPDIQQLSLGIKQAEAGIGKADAQFYPKLQLAGAVNGARQGSFRLNGDDLGNTIFLNLSWNLFAGGVDQARRFEAEQARREVNSALMTLRNQVAAEVRQGVALLEAAREQVLLQRESVLLVEENRDLARSEYEAGQTSLVRLNEAQRDLSTTYGRLAQAQVAWQRARQRLLAATGRNVTGLAEAVVGP